MYVGYSLGKNYMTTRLFIIEKDAFFR
jgi:hypothetical protein